MEIVGYLIVFFLCLGALRVLFSLFASAVNFRGWKTSKAKSTPQRFLDEYHR